MKFTVMVNFAMQVVFGHHINMSFGESEMEKEENVMASEYCKFPHCECSMGAAERCKRIRTRRAPVDANLLTSNSVDDKIAPDANSNAPAATDTGLETVAKVDSHLGDMSRLSIIDRPLSIGTEVCLRSQAEELLAAERAALPILKGTAFKSGDGWKDTTKEGDICFVWNRMHPAPYAPGQYPRVGKEHWSASIENYTFEPATLGEVSKLFADLKADNAALTARVKELEKECDDFCADLNQERKSHESAHNRAEDLKAKLAAAEQAARAAHETLIEINPSNYNHDDVCQLNDASVEAIFLLADILGETHGKTKEWWDERRAVLAGK